MLYLGNQVKYGNWDNLVEFFEKISVNPNFPGFFNITSVLTLSNFKKLNIFSFFSITQEPEDI